MGMHASADIYFGITLYDPDGEGDLDDFLAAAAGLTRPDEDYPDDDDKSPEGEDLRKEFSVYWDAKRILRDAFTLEEDHVGYVDGYAIRILKLRGWGARSGYQPEMIAGGDLIVTDEHRATFQAAMEQLGFASFPEPQIHLAASYG